MPWLTFFLFLVPMAAQAADSVGRSRNYPGGRDEQDLQVQAQLPQPMRTPDEAFKKPVIEDDHDHGDEE